MKENKCQLCGWKGRTHLHHIIPKKKNGVDNQNNIIEICPNHHAEATEKESAFAKKFNLLGKSKSNEELKALKEYSFLHHELFCLREGLKKMEELEEKYNFDKLGVTAYMMGITRDQVEKTYGSFIDA